MGKKSDDFFKNNFGTDPNFTDEQKIAVLVYQVEMQRGEIETLRRFNGKLQDLLDDEQLNVKSYRRIVDGLGVQPITPGQFKTL